MEDAVAVVVDEGECTGSGVKRGVCENPTVQLNGVVIQDLNALILQQNPFLAFPRQVELPVGDRVGLDTCEAERWYLVFVAWVVDVIIPIVLLVLAFALKTSPIGVGHESGNWINAPVTNTFIVSAYFMQMKACFLLSFRLLIKHFECVSMKISFYAYTSVSALSFIQMIFVAVSTSQIVKEAYVQDSSKGAIEIIYAFLCGIYLLLRLTGCIYFEKCIVNINSHANGLHKYCNHDPNFYLPLFNIWQRNGRQLVEQEMC